MEKLIWFLVVAVLAVAIMLGAYWLLWLLWLWVLPQIYPSGPSALISPGYWLFSAAWFLATLIGKGIFGSRSK
jgi:hypothetical protein